MAAGAGWRPGRLPGHLPDEVLNELFRSWGNIEEEEGGQSWNKWIREQL